MSHTGTLLIGSEWLTYARVSAGSKHKQVQKNAYLIWHGHRVCKFSSKSTLSSHKTTLKQQLTVKEDKLVFFCFLLVQCLVDCWRFFFFSCLRVFVLCIVVIVAVLLAVALFLLPCQTCDLVACVLNWCKGILSVWFVPRWLCSWRDVKVPELSHLWLLLLHQV